jgi:hypothetical protein
VGARRAKVIVDVHVHLAAEVVGRLVAVDVDNPSFLHWVPHIGGRANYTLGVLWVVAVFAVVLVGVLRDPDLRIELQVGAAVIVFSMLLGTFSAMYSQTAHDHANGANSCFAYVQDRKGHLRPATVGHTDALYFTVGVLTTAGTGELQPHSRGCRQVVTVQELIDFVFLSTALGLLVARVSRRAANDEGESHHAEPTTEHSATE